MSIQSEIDRINGAKNSIKSAISSKGVSVPSDASIEDLPALVRSIPQEGGSSSGSGIIDITELPTDGIDESAVYRLTENIQLEKTEIYFKDSVYELTVNEYFQSLGVPTIPNVYVVDDLSNMKVTDVQTFSEIHLYILRSNGIVYANVPALGGTITCGLFGWQDLNHDHGFTEDIYAETEDGVYTTIEAYKQVQRWFARKDGEWEEITAYIPSTLPNGFSDVEILSGEYSTEELVITQSDNFKVIDVAEKLRNDKIIPKTITIDVFDIATFLKRQNPYDKYDVDETWFVDKNGEPLYELRRGCFYDASLHNVTIPDTISIIPERAFNFSNLESISLPNNLGMIEQYAFEYTTYLTHIQIPDTVEYIGNLAFSSCGLTEIVLPKSLKQLGDQVFLRSNSLKTVTFQSKPAFTAYGNYVFLECQNITTINVPWSEGEVAGAPWGATNATINYNYTEV